MSQRVRDNLARMKRIQHLKEDKKRKFIECNCDRKLVECFCECAKNVLKGCVPLTARQFKRLRRWKKTLQTLSIKKPSLKNKKKLLQQGGFLGALLPPVLSFLGGLVSSGISNGTR